MTTPIDIIGKARQLVALREKNTRRKGGIDKTDFAQALIEREEKLKLAVAALETLKRCPALIVTQPREQQPWFIAKEALSRIRSL